MFKTMERRRRDAEKEAATFNATNPIGTQVRYWSGVREGDGLISKTRSVASVLGGHSAVVWLEGVTGCISLSHVQPLEPAAA